MKKIIIILFVLISFSCYDDSTKTLTYEVITDTNISLQVLGECNGLNDSLQWILVDTPFVYSKKVYDNHKYFITIYEIPSPIVSDGAIFIYLDDELIDSTSFTATITEGAIANLSGYIDF